MKKTFLGKALAIALTLSMLLSMMLVTLVPASATNMVDDSFEIGTEIEDPSTVPAGSPAIIMTGDIENSHLSNVPESDNGTGVSITNDHTVLYIGSNSTADCGKWLVDSDVSFAIEDFPVVMCITKNLCACYADDGKCYAFEQGFAYLMTGDSFTAANDNKLSCFEICANAYSIDGNNYLYFWYDTSWNGDQFRGRINGTQFNFRIDTETPGANTFEVVLQAFFRNEEEAAAFAVEYFKALGWRDINYNDYNRGYRDGYQNGLDNGYQQGYEDGRNGYDATCMWSDIMGDFSDYEFGYNDGYNDGYAIGYDSGYADGWLEYSNNNTNWETGDETVVIPNTPPEEETTYNTEQAPGENGGNTEDNGDNKGNTNDFNNGYEAGKKDGYSQGYNDGLRDSNSNSGNSNSYNDGYNAGYEAALKEIGGAIVTDIQGCGNSIGGIAVVILTAIPAAFFIFKRKKDE